VSGEIIDTDPDFSIPSWDNIDEDTHERTGSDVIRTQYLSVENHMGNGRVKDRDTKSMACERTKHKIMVYALSLLRSRSEPLFPNSIRIRLERITPQSGE
jgi:hypothetical protein